ncbi:MAG TPA: pyridoxal-phosphate dependent enzyme [Acetobacteraceae bacterium]|nr:pyridoxal-phosphate dependent enzyme [Acetobacteraceae bacterium]
MRRTPLIAARHALRPATPAELWLKLECLQVTGSFKARGAMNRLLTTPAEALQRGIVTASGGNHGVAVARAGHIAGVKTTVFLPANASPLKRRKLAAWGAEVRIDGQVWDESDRAARAFAQAEGATYFHPFADPAVVAGQGTVALEILDELPDSTLYLIAIGGGGLAAGMATALRALRPQARLIGIEPVGAPTLHASLAAGGVVTLPRVTTTVPTMACGRTDERIYDIIQRTLDDIVLIEDAAMLDAASWLWFEMGIAADPSGAAAVAALRSGAVVPRSGERVCALVCGAGSEGLG